MQKVIFITGVTSGIGRACAERLLRDGHIIFGTSRKVSYPTSAYKMDQINLLPLDLQNEESINRAVQYVKKVCGRIDVLVNNAGIGLAGSIEETPLFEAKKLMDVNFFGHILLIQEVMPVFRQQSFGLIINISSLAGIFSLPFQGYYSATKFAIEAISEALYMELKKSKISIVVVQPGDLVTGFTDARREFIKEGSYYEQRIRKALKIARNDEKKGMNPIYVAEQISKIVNSKNPSFRYIVGKEVWYVKILHLILPDRIFLFFLSRHYGI